MKTTTRWSTKKLGSVQATYCPARELGPDYLTLYAPDAPGKRELRGVLEVSGMSYYLKSEEEQRLINDVFQTVLASLTYPLQILMRVLPLDIEKYIATITACPDNVPEAAVSEHNLLWPQAAESYARFIRSLTSKRTLLERHFYVIIPSGMTPEEDFSFRQQFALPSQKRATREAQAMFAQSIHQLDVRCNELSRQLLAMGLSVHRLEGPDLAQLEASCFLPDEAQAYPLHQEWIETIDRLPIRSDAPSRQANSASEDLLADILNETPAKRFRKSEKPHGIAWPDLANLISPAGIRVTSNALIIESDYTQTLTIHTLPRQVTPGWFSQLVTINEPMDISWYYAPQKGHQSMRDLKRKYFEMSSTKTLSDEVGRLETDLQVKMRDIEDLMTRIASGQDRLLTFSMHILVRGRTKRDMLDRAARIKAVLHSMLLGVRPVLFEQDRGFRSCLPHNRNELHNAENPIVMPTREAATTFPFLSQSLIIPTGMLEGITKTGEPIILDWWSKTLRNGNRLYVGPSGSGKSFDVKMFMGRLYIRYGKELLIHPNNLPFQFMVVDIEREYLRATKRFGGQQIQFAPGSPHRLNPFDLPRTNHHTKQQTTKEDVLAEKVTQLQALLDIMLADHGPNGSGTLTEKEKSLLDTALYATYAAAGITQDKSTHQHVPPLMSDLATVLQESGKDITGLADRLHRYVKGSLSGMFAGQTNVVLDNPFVCFDIHDLPKDLRNIAIFLISSHVWNVCFESTIPRWFVVDELATIYQYEEGKAFLESLFQRARKYYLSVIGLTQYPKMLLDSTIPTNCAINVIMAQELASLPLIQEVFKLSTPEIQMVRSFGKGEALFLSGDKRFAIRFEASPEEYEYCTSDPVDIAEFDAADTLINAS